MENSVLLEALNEVINKEVEKRVAEKSAQSEITNEKVVEKINRMGATEWKELLSAICEEEGNREVMIDFLKSEYTEEIENIDNDSLITLAKDRLDSSDVIDIVEYMNLEQEITQFYIDNCDRSEAREIIDNLLDSHF